MIPNLNPKNDPYCCISAAPAKSQLLSERITMSDMSTVRFTRPVMIPNRCSCRYHLDD
jgi:hypothetical protein